MTDFREEVEARCYSPRITDFDTSTIGVREISRLISRLRHRQFGVLVTASAIARQGYEEVGEDRHPTIFISGRDIAEILVQNARDVWNQGGRTGEYRALP